MDPAQSPESSSAPGGFERRKHLRHEFIQPVSIVTGTGAKYLAMSFELSEGGMSVATTEKLTVGETVYLTPVMGERVKAIVRRNHGTMYGFEFDGLPAATREQIRKLCQRLPLFRSMAPI